MPSFPSTLQNFHACDSFHSHDLKDSPFLVLYIQESFSKCLMGGAAFFSVWVSLKTWGNNAREKLIEIRFSMESTWQCSIVDRRRYREVWGSFIVGTFKGAGGAGSFRFSQNTLHDELYANPEVNIKIQYKRKLIFTAYFLIMRWI